MAEASTRLDKWLWHARLARTRTLAQKLIAAGKVRLNRNKIDAPSQAVRVGDVLTIALPGRVLVCRIAGLAERRGPFTQARELYVDLGAPARTKDGEDDAPAAPTATTETATSVPQARPGSRERLAARALRGKAG